MIEKYIDFTGGVWYTVITSFAGLFFMQKIFANKRGRLTLMEVPI